MCMCVCVCVCMCVCICVHVCCLKTLRDLWIRYCANIRFLFTLYMYTYIVAQLLSNCSLPLISVVVALFFIKPTPSPTCTVILPASCLNPNQFSATPTSSGSSSHTSTLTCIHKSTCSEKYLIHNFLRIFFVCLLITASGLQLGMLRVQP